WVNRDQGARLLLSRGDVSPAFRVGRCAWVVRKSLRKDTKDCHQFAVTGGDPVHAQGLTLTAPTEELRRGEQVIDDRGVSLVGHIHARDLRRAAEANGGLGAETVLAAVAGLAHDQLALEEFDAARPD